MLRSSTAASRRARTRNHRSWVVASIIAAVSAGVLTIPGTQQAATTGLASQRASLAAEVSSAVKHATSNSLDPYGSAGMNVDAAQQTIAAGAAAAGGIPHVIVAYIEGGINWFNGSSQTLADSVYVNWHDTPVPCVGSTVATAIMTLKGATVPCATAYSSRQSDYDTNGDGVITVQDWSQDPRVNPDANGVGFLNPEDLIAAFSGAGFVPTHPRPAGYADAISGWDFYDNQNDPATTDSAYGHSDGQMNVIHTICPSCLILPVKAGDEAIDSTEALAKAWLFAAQSGAKVIVSVTADLGYSTFAKEVLQYLDAHGVIVVESSNDFDSADHQGGMYWDNVIPGNGLVPNTAGVPSGSSTLGQMTGPFWTRSDYTSFGVHDMFSVATNGGSTSESTPTTGAVLALLLSEGDEAAATGAIPAPLTGPQAVQVLRLSSTEPVAPAGASLPWPSGPGDWNEQYGWGMPDAESAVTAIAAGDVPASPEIDSPDWYAVTDPTRQSAVTVTGTVSAFPSQSYDWYLEYNTGGDPQTWHTIAKGAATGPFSGTFGTLNLHDIPQSFYRATFTLSQTKELETMDTYDVTFRVMTSVVGAVHLTGEARRVIDVFHDPSALAGFPMQIGPSGESQPALVDLDGTGRLDIVFGTADGTIEAIDPATGKELPGWPVHTDRVVDANLPVGVSAGYQPILSDVAVGDLEGTGKLSVVATSEDGYVYVFNNAGKLLPGWPQLMDDGVVAPAIPRPSEGHERLPQVGATSAPVLVTLGSAPVLDVVQSGWDGEIHAWAPDGTALPGWPVRVTLTPAEENLPSGYTLEDDQKLDTSPAVAHFAATGAPDLVIRSQYTEIGPSAGGLQALPYSFVFAYTAAGQLVTGWPVRPRGVIEDYGSAQEFITEGTDAPAVADVLGKAGGSIDQVAVGPVWSANVLVGAAGKVLGSYGQDGAVLHALLTVLENPALAIFGPLPGPTPMPFTGSGAFGILGSGLTFADPSMSAESLAGAIIYPGSGNPISQLDAVWPASAGTLGASNGPGTDELAGFPTAEQGQDFLGQPLIAPVGTTADNDLITGGDSSAVNAQTSAGAEVPGFPKFTGGWTTYAPSAGDLLGNGHDDLVTLTREGYLFVWTTRASAPVTGSWYRAAHDEYNSSNLSTDSRPPGVVRYASIVGSTLRFVAPGANWYDGQASDYQVIFVTSGHRGPVQTIAATAPASTLVRMAVVSGTSAVFIRTVNADGLVSNAERVTSGGETTVAWP